MKKFKECREDVIQEAVGMTWEHFLANYRLIDGSLIDVYSERAAEVYAKQFQVMKPNDQTLNQHDFNMFEAGYLGLLEFYNKHQKQEPKDSDIEIAALEWFKDNRGSYVPFIWKSAIEWYKTKKATD